MSLTMLGVIGGSGFYDLPEIEEARDYDLTTPYGKPSDAIRVGRLGEMEIAFLSRHGRGHRLTPSELPYQANIYAMKEAGVTHLLSISAVGSLKATLPPLSLVLPDQIIDRTVARPRSFFGQGVVAHVGIADPFCPHLRERLAAVIMGSGRDHQYGGTYVCIEGPQFSTKAESQLYRSWGASIIGMTAMPEARLAREAELCYATLALVTDFDVWHETESPVTVETVMANLVANVEAGRELIRGVATGGMLPGDCDCRHALRNTIVTDVAAVTAEARQRLGIIADGYLPATGDPSS
ncbi:MAG: S-methyl-5'-thioadenosine phosphorylase [Chloroflexota bacterium]|nr:S-methyl-5'-thioadenosine phosphorylase [Chloroflexota bacterium]MDP9469924.1 S-methyl-5'-thioadenosine phosphorylase [Chloroflexota bacterium]